MNEQTGAIQAAEPTTPADPSIRHRRIEALQRAQRARRILDREAELAARYGDRRRRVDPDDGDGDGHEGADHHREDVERLLEIHRSLRHERAVARRPFHRRSGRLVLALELAERLALERLGYVDFADFEAHAGDGRPEREVIDVDLLAWAERELTEAEAVLAELDGTAPATSNVVHLPTWTVDPVLRRANRVRATRARRRVFGAGTPSLFDRPRPEELPEGGAPTPPLPFRAPTGGRSADRANAAAPRSDASGDGVLGEIVHNGRVVRVEKVGGLLYGDEDDPGAGAITYGDPNRPG